MSSPTAVPISPSLRVDPAAAVADGAGAAAGGIGALGAAGRMPVAVADGGDGDYMDEEITDARKEGIADGGHTFAVISNTMLRMDDLKNNEDWTEPYVRVRFITTSKAASTASASSSGATPRRARSSNA